MLLTLQADGLASAPAASFAVYRYTNPPIGAFAQHMWIELVMLEDLHALTADREHNLRRKLYASCSFSTTHAGGARRMFSTLSYLRDIRPASGSLKSGVVMKSLRSLIRCGRPTRFLRIWHNKAPLQLITRLARYSHMLLAQLALMVCAILTSHINHAFKVHKTIAMRRVVLEYLGKPCIVGLWHHTLELCEYLAQGGAELHQV